MRVIQRTCKSFLRTVAAKTHSNRRIGRGGRGICAPPRRRRTTVTISHARGPSLHCCASGNSYPRIALSKQCIH